jgi:hypothetical protein
MHFTSNLNLRRVVGGILTVPVLGLTGWVNPVIAAPAPAQTRQAGDIVAVLPAVDRTPAPGLQTARPGYYQAHWYNSKHWWKRNAPIVGGAGGGALIGGLAGGGAGALIGGAAGAGGGALYKHYHHRHRYYNH